MTTSSADLGPAVADVAVALGALAVAMGLLAWFRTRELRGALGLVLDMLLVAGLLRLTVSETWTVLASTALIVVIRKLATTGLRFGAAARRTGGAVSVPSRGGTIAARRPS